MKFDEAMNVIKQAAATYRGTLQDHQLLQDAIRTVETQGDAVVSVKKPKKKKEK